MSVHIGAEAGDIAPTVLLPGDPMRAKYIAENYLEEVYCYNQVRGMHGFTGRYQGKLISVQGTGMGIPSISIYLHELINQYQVGDTAFKDIGVDVAAHYFSMNADVAKLVMDQVTAEKLGKIVVIDHYVAAPEKLNQDVEEIARNSGSKVILGEFGVPIPDIHGTMDPEQQAKWVEDALNLLAKNSNLVGLNYWLAVDGSTQIWNEVSYVSPVSEVLKKYYSPQLFNGRVVDSLNSPIKDVSVAIGNKTVVTNWNGEFTLPYTDNISEMHITSDGYVDKSAVIESNKGEIILDKIDEDIEFRLRRYLKNTFGI